MNTITTIIFYDCAEHGGVYVYDSAYVCVLMIRHVLMMMLMMVMILLMMMMMLMLMLMMMVMILMMMMVMVLMMMMMLMMMLMMMMIRTCLKIVCALQMAILSGTIRQWILDDFGAFPQMFRQKPHYSISPWNRWFCTIFL